MKKHFLMPILVILSACSSVSSTSGSGNTTVDPSEVQVYMFGTDYASSGQVYSADFQTVTDLTNTGLSGLGSSATATLSGGLLYILHDGYSVGSLDNIQIIDPVDGFTTVNQWSTVTAADGTNNPHDAIIIGNKAYISLYNASSDSENLDAAGHPGDVIVMNLDTGEIEENISFFDFLNADGDVNAFADQMVLVGTDLYVCLQDLQSDFSHNAAGKIGVIDTVTNTVTDVIELQGRNPVDIVASDDEGTLFVALQAPYDFALGNFDTSNAFGGLEIIPLDDPDNTTLLADEDLGGYVERLAAGGDSVFAVVSQMDSVTFAFTSQIAELPQDGSTLAEVSTFLENSSDVREIAIDPIDRLWVSRRSISADDGSASDPQVDVFDIETGEVVGESLVPTVPVTSIVMGTI